VDRSGRAVLVANYVGGSIALLPLDHSGSLGSATHIDQHQGKGPNAERQEGPHAHCIVTDPSNRYALATDLGVDRIFVYRLDLDRGALGVLDDGAAHLKAGAGPRHIAFHPRLPIVYVVNELDSTITTLRFDPEHGVLRPIGTQSTLPSGWSGTNSGADIHVAPSGRVLYTSNRGHNSIAVFSVAESTGMVSLEQTMSTSGDTPRNFTLDPTGRWLLVGNQNSGSIVVIARDEKTGMLSPTPQRLELPSPVCLRFRAHVGVTT
jgi:6-phosphogluconolactonase